MLVKILGHRGSGASDAPFNQQRDKDAGIIRPDENTILSHLQAMTNAAEGTETDLIETADNDIVLVHANDYAQHIMYADSHNSVTRVKPFIDQLSVSEIRQHLLTGRDFRSHGGIPTLRNLLTTVRLYFPDAFLNLELKGKQDTRPTHQRPSLTMPSLAEKTVKIIEATDFPPNQIRFSSFATSYLKGMAEICEEAELGILFDLPQDQGGDVGLPMFCDRPDVYQAFTVAAMEKVLEDIPTLTAVHPEIQSLNHRNVGFAARHDLKIATWGWKEYSPIGTGEGNIRFAKALTNAFNLCTEHGISELTIITDHIIDVRNFLKVYGYKLDQ